MTLDQIILELQRFLDSASSSESLNLETDRATLERCYDALNEKPHDIFALLLRTP